MRTASSDGASGSISDKPGPPLLDADEFARQVRRGTEADQREQGPTSKDGANAGDKVALRLALLRTTELQGRLDELV